MSVTLYLGLRLSGVAYKRISYTLNDDAFSTFTVENLKKVIAGELLENYSKDAVAGLGKFICFEIHWITYSIVPDLFWLFVYHSYVRRTYLLRFSA